MPSILSNQAYIFFCSVVGGLVIAFIYDLFRIQRKAIKTTGLIIYIEDLAYWIIVALVMFSVVYYSNDGELRGYIFIGTILGVILYMLLLSKIIIGISLFILRITYKTLKAIFYVLLFPIKIIIKILRVPAKLLLKLFRFLFVSGRKVGRSGISKTRNLRRTFRNMRKKI